MAIEKHRRTLEAQRIALQRFARSGQDNEESYGRHDQQRDREISNELSQLRYAVVTEKAKNMRLRLTVDRLKK